MRRLSKQRTDYILKREREDNHEREGIMKEVTAGKHKETEK
jgi:hypothetical protein